MLTHIRAVTLFAATTSALALPLAGPAAASPYFPDTPLPTGEFSLEKQSDGLFNQTKRSTVTINGASVIDGSKSVLAGGFSVQEKGSNPTDKFIAWCVDTLEYLSFGVKYEITDTPFLDANLNISAEKQSLITKLFDAAYDGVLAAIPDRKKSAGFQLALWEIVNETTRDTNGDLVFDVASGRFLRRQRHKVKRR